MKTCKKHIKDPVICYSDCAGCEMQRLTDERNQLKAENARSTEREIRQLAEIEALRKNSTRYLHLKANWEDGLLLERLMGNVLPQDWDAEIDKDMSKEKPL